MHDAHAGRCLPAQLASMCPSGCCRHFRASAFARVQVMLQYHIRVMIPCYKEDLDIVQRTVLAALGADLPAGCERTVYLCDDGKDPGKRQWAQARSCACLMSHYILPIGHAQALA